MCYVIKVISLRIKNSFCKKIMFIPSYVEYIHPSASDLLTRLELLARQLRAAGTHNIAENTRLVPGVQNTIKDLINMVQRQNDAREKSKSNFFELSSSGLLFSMIVYIKSIDDNTRHLTRWRHYRDKEATNRTGSGRQNLQQSPAISC